MNVTHKRDCEYSLDLIKQKLQCVGSLTRERTAVIVVMGSLEHIESI